MVQQSWLMYALLSALCASLVGIFGKIGMNAIDSTLATIVRSLVMSVFLAVLGTVVGVWPKVGTLTGRALIAIVLSGMAGAASWLFYFKALQLGTVSQVAPIDKLSMPLAIVLAVWVLRDRPTLINWAGILLIAVGAYFASMPRPEH